MLEGNLKAHKSSETRAGQLKNSVWQDVVSLYL